MPFLYIAALFQRLSCRHYSVAQQFTSKLHLCCAFLRFSIADHICSFPSPRCSVPLRLITVLFQDQAFLSYSAAFCSHSFAHLLHAVPLLRISKLFFSIASPLPTVLVLIRSARFCCYALLIYSMPTHYISLLCLSKHSYAFSFLCCSIPLQNLTFPLQCISFLFHCRSWLINAVTSLCSAKHNFAFS